MADAGIVCVDGGEETGLEHFFEGMNVVVGDDFGLDVAGEVDFDADLIFEHVIDKFGILKDVSGVADALCTEIVDGTPDRFGTSNLPCVGSDTEAGIAGFLEGFDELIGWIVIFVSGEIYAGDVATLGKNGLHF